MFVNIFLFTFPCVVAWRWGHISLPSLQQIAGAAAKDIAAVRSTPLLNLWDLTALAQLGGSGARPQHMHRQVLLHIGPTTLSPVITASIPLKLQGGVRDIEQCIVLPHVLFAQIYHEYPAVWKKRILPSTEALQEFWDDMQTHPMMPGHPIRQREHFERLCVPFTLHGDGCPMTGAGKSWCKMMDIFSWTSWFARGSTTDNMFYIWSCFLPLMAKGEAITADTYKTFFKILAWSFLWLWKGLWPTHDWNGRAYKRGTREWKLAHEVRHLAGGFFGLLFGILGDLDFLAKGIGLEFHGATATHPCVWCPATLEHLNWRDFRPQATWKQHCYTKRSWSRTHDEHPLLSLPFCCIFTILADYMHVKYLGVDQYFFGSVFCLLVWVILPGTAKQNCDKLFDRLKHFYVQLRTRSRYNSLNPNMLRKQGQAKLKGRAAEIKHLGSVLGHVWAELMDPGDALHVTVKLALQNNRRMDEILQDNPGPNKLPTAVAADFLETTHRFLTLYQEASRLVVDGVAAGNIPPGITFFSITVKAHVLLHCALQAGWAHPFRTYCFAGEDFMKHSKRLIGACCRAMSAQHVSSKFAEKYVLALDTSFRRLQQDEPI